MAEELPKGTPAPTPAGGDKTPKNEDGKSEIDPVQALAQRDHWRKKAEDAQALLDQKAADDKTAEDAKLVEQAKWQEIAEKSKAEVTETLAKLQQSEGTIKGLKITHALTNELIKRNPVDLDAAIKLADLSKVQVSDDGAITGLDTVVSGLVETRPFLFGTNKPNINNGPKAPNPTPGAKSGKIWTRAEIAEVGKDPIEYAKVREEILLAKQEGRIES